MDLENEGAVPQPIVAVPPAAEPAPAPAAEPAPAPPARKLHPAFRLVAFFLTLILGGFAIYWIATGLGLRKSKVLDDTAPISFLILSILVVAQGLLANAVGTRLERRPLSTIGFRRSGSVVRDIALGLFTGALTPTIVAVGFFVAGAATIKAVPTDWLGVTLPMIVGMTLISSSEEILLRGYFMQVIAAMGGPITAAVVSGLVFGLMHAGNPGANPMGLITTGVNGILLAYLMVRMGSMWLACAYHAGWNLIAALGFGMRDSGMLSPGAIASTELHGSAIWTGGSYGFEASVISFVAEWFVLFALLKWGPRVVFDPVAQPYFAMTKRPTTAPSEVSTR